VTRSWLSYSLALMASQQPPPRSTCPSCGAETPPGAGKDRPYILGDLTWKAVRDAKYEVAVLPWAATEPHNFHLPYSTDTVETERIAALAARLAWERGARVVVLPVIPFGVNTGQLDLPLCLNMNPSTQAHLLRDLATALAGQGVGKLVILNGHGGNDFRQMIRELQPAVSVFLCTVNWYQAVDPKRFFADLGDHAGELETSVMLHLAPELVRSLSEAGPGAARRFRIPALREGWAWAPRQWRQVTDDTGVGNPAAATGDKGRAYVEAVSEKIAGFLVELASTDPEDMYEATE
jgi:creatinine amidohydrolase